MIVVMTIWQIWHDDYGGNEIRSWSLRVHLPVEQDSCESSLRRSLSSALTWSLSPDESIFSLFFLSFLSIFFLPKSYVVIIIPIRLSHSSFTRPCTINIEEMIFFQIMTRCAEICQFYLPHSNFVVSIYHIQNMSFLLTAFKTLLFTAFKDCISAPRLATSGATSGTSAMTKILEFEFESH